MQQTRPHELSKHAQVMAAGIEGLRSRKAHRSQQMPPEQTLSQSGAGSEQQTSPRQQLTASMSQQQHPGDAQLQGRELSQQMTHHQSPAQQDVAQQAGPSSSNQQSLQSAASESGSSNTAAEDQSPASLAQSAASEDAPADLLHSRAQQELIGLDNLLDAIIAGQDGSVNPSDHASVPTAVPGASLQPSFGSSSQRSEPSGSRVSSPTTPAPSTAAQHQQTRPAAIAELSEEFASQDVEQLPAKQASVQQPQVQQAHAPPLKFNTHREATVASGNADSVTAQGSTTVPSPLTQASSTTASASGDTAAAAEAAATRSTAANSHKQPPKGTAYRDMPQFRPRKLKLGVAANRRKPSPKPSQSVAGRSPPNRSSVPGGLLATQTSNSAPRQVEQRKVISEQMSAEEFHRLNASAADVRRPAWASNEMYDPKPEPDMVPVPAAQGSQHESGVSSSGGRALSRAELQALAERRGLNFERLLADATSKGVIVEPAGAM